MSTPELFALVSSASSAIVFALWRACWQGAITALVVWSICRALPRLPATVRCWLWRAVLLKFVFTLVWPVGLRVPIIARGISTTAMAVAKQGQRAPVLPSNEFEARRPEVRQPIHIPMDRGLYLLMPSTAGDKTTASQLAAGPAQSAPFVVTPTGTTETRTTLLISALLTVYLAGVAVCAVRLVGLALQTRRFVRETCESVTDAETIADAIELTRRFGLRAMSNLLMSSEVGSSLLVTAVRPAIVLPAAENTNFDREARRLMIAHELAHLRRRDLPWNWLAAVAHTLFFFHPLVWLARREEDLAREMDCDLLAIEATDAPIAQYGALIAAIVTHRGAGVQTSTFFALGISNDVSNVRRRLLALGKMGSPMSVPRLRLLVGAVGVVTVGALVPWHVVAAANAAKPETASTEDQTDANPAHVVDLPPGSGVIEGRVNVAPTGVPGRGCLIRLFDGAHPKTMYRLTGAPRSDVSGRYRIEHVPAGAYRVNVWQTEDADFFSASPKNGNVLLTLREGQRLSDQNLQVVSNSATVFGKISDLRSGQPVTNVSVAGASESGGEKSAFLWLPVGKDGSYRVHVPPGNSAAFVKHAGDNSLAASWDSPYRTPRSSLTHRTLVVARPGQAIKADIGLAAERISAATGTLPPITGRVIGPNGEPIAGADVNFYGIADARNSKPWNRIQSVVRTNADGQFCWEGLTENWAGKAFEIVARDNTSSRAISQPMHLTLPLHGTTTPLTLRLLPRFGARLEGKVVDEQGLPLPGALVSLFSGDIVAQFMDRTFTDSKGGYRFSGLLPNGGFIVTADRNGYGSGAHINRGPLLRPGEHRTITPFVAKRGKQSIAGVLVTSSGAPASPHRVMVYQGPEGRWHSAWTDTQGRFQIDDLIPGHPKFYLAGDPSPLPVRVQAGDTHLRIVAKTANVPPHP